MSNREVVKVLARLPLSRYYEMNSGQILALLSPSEARRYLSILTILNDKEKSNLSEVDELSLSQELSALMDSVEAKEMSLPSFSSIMNLRKLA